MVENQEIECLWSQVVLCQPQSVCALTSAVRQVRSGLDFWIHSTGIHPRCLAAISKGKHLP